MKEIVKKAATAVGIEKELESAPSELSGGQKQRVSLAGVMVGNAKILLFDEPLANLDPKTGKSAIELIDEIQKITKATVIIIEHRLEDVLWKHVDRIILMDDGQIIQDSTPNELLSGDALKTHGIREPLYLTCVKYAGVTIAKDKNPEHIDELVLNDSDTALIQNWYESTKFELPKNENSSILRIEDLSFKYPSNSSDTLKHVSFDIKKGEMLAIVGQNGAGKSTLAKLICGFETTNRGKIYFNNTDITNDSIRSRAKNIGYVMQNPNQMISQAKIFDEVALGLKSMNLSEEEIKEKVYDALKVCGLYEFRNWPISALSYGQKKRVTIASVLVMGPSIIILDEPTAGQDFKHYTDIMEFLKKLNETGITIIMITHDMHLMLEYTQRGLVIVNGELICDALTSEILCDHEIVEKASLKETSLFTLATRCNISDPVAFTNCFIHYDRMVRDHGC